MTGEVIIARLIDVQAKPSTNLFYPSIALTMATHTCHHFLDPAYIATGKSLTGSEISG